MYSGTFYRHFLGRRANLERRVDTQRDRGIHGKPGFAILLESRVTNGDVIDAHRQGGKDVEPHRVSLNALADSSPGIESRDRSFRNHCA